MSPLQSGVMEFDPGCILAGSAGPGGWSVDGGGSSTGASSGGGMSTMVVVAPVPLRVAGQAMAVAEQVPLRVAGPQLIIKENCIYRKN